jgi:hypothetical protein
MSIAGEIVVQVALRDIGQLTDIDRTSYVRPRALITHRLRPDRRAQPTALDAHTQAYDGPRTASALE